MTGINLLPYAAPIRGSVCQRTKFPKRIMISGRRIFFSPPSPSPSPFPSFALAPTVKVTISTLPNLPLS